MHQKNKSLSDRKGLRSLILTRANRNIQMKKMEDIMNISLPHLSTTLPSMFQHPTSLLACLQR